MRCTVHGEAFEEFKGWKRLNFWGVGKSTFFKVKVTAVIEGPNPLPAGDGGPGNLLQAEGEGGGRTGEVAFGQGQYAAFGVIRSR
jgi:hypothetical protein